MNGSRIEQFNQLVRGIVVLLLVGGFIYGFVVSKVVNTESFAIVLGVAMTWWFSSRDKKQADDATKSAAQPPGAPPTPTA